MGKLFLPAEKAAAAQNGSKSLAELLDEVRADEKLSTAAHWEDGNKIRDGILVRAPEEMIEYASQYKVREDELEEKTAEMTNAAGKADLHESFHEYGILNRGCSVLHRRRSASSKADQD